MGLEFKNTGVQKKYVILVAHDHDIRTPDGYMGKVTDISNPAVLDGMISRGTKLVALKPDVGAGSTLKAPETNK